MNRAKNGTKLVNVATGGDARTHSIASVVLSSDRRPTRASKGGVRTLAVDVGGSGIKLDVLDERGSPLTDRVRVPTPRPATPRAVLAVVLKLAKRLGHFDRVSVGFPGVVRSGVVHTAPNLGPQWNDFDLERALRRILNRPVRVLNDADVQGLGVIKGRGLEMILTLGTGVGSALFVNGTLVPNLEFGHHPFAKGKTYEQLLGRAALDKWGKKKWNRRLRAAIQQLEPIFNYDVLYLGGGNTKYIKDNPPLLPNVKIVENFAGLLGGIALWRGDLW